MKVAFLVALALLVSASLAKSRIGYSSADVGVLVIKDNVREAMAIYATRLDQLVIVCGATNVVSSPACMAALDAVVDTFCEKDLLRGAYVSQPALLGGISNQRIFYGPVSVSDDLLSATFVGNYIHTKSNVNGTIVVEYGTYNNTFEVDPTTFSVCMSVFNVTVGDVFEAAPAITKHV